MNKNAQLAEVEKAREMTKHQQSLNGFLESFRHANKTISNSRRVLFRKTPVSL